MDLHAFLNAADTARVERTLRNLAPDGVSSLALTGGVAIELRLAGRGAKTPARPLHDIDLLTPSFEEIPHSIGQTHLLRHVHPHDPPGKILLQAVDPETQVRVDIFRAYGAEMARTTPITIAGTTLNLVSLEDMLARHARLVWDVVEGRPVEPKFARDLLRMAGLVSTDEVESIWQEHRQPHHPRDFSQTLALVREAISARADLLVPSTWSTNPHEQCHRCHGTHEFPLADASQILKILSYC